MNVVNITKWIFPSSIFLLIFVSRVRSTITNTTNSRNAQQEIELSGNYSIPGTTPSPSLNPERKNFLQLSTHKPMKQVKVHLFEMRGSRFRRGLLPQACLNKETIWRRCCKRKCQQEHKMQKDPCQESCRRISTCCRSSCEMKFSFIPETDEILRNKCLTNPEICQNRISGWIERSPRDCLIRLQRKEQKAAKQRKTSS